MFFAFVLFSTVSKIIAKILLILIQNQSKLSKKRLRKEGTRRLIIPKISSIYPYYCIWRPAGDTTVVLAEDVPISEISNQAYVIESTETGIIDRTSPAVAAVPTQTPIGILALISLLCIIAVSRIRKRS